MRAVRAFASRAPSSTAMQRNRPTPKAAPKPAAAKPLSSVVDKGTHLAFTIQAKPGSKKSQISSIEEEFIGVNIGARPVDGEANDELLEYLGSVLQVKKRHLSLSKASSKSRAKVVLLENDPPLLSLEEAIARLRSALSDGDG